MTRIRLADPHDVPDLTRLRLAWAMEKGAPTDDPAFGTRFKAWLDSEADRRTFWVAETSAGVVGMVNLVTFTRMPYPDGTDFAAA